MKENQYSLKEMVQELKEDFVEFKNDTKGSLITIDQKVTKTNGTVRSLQIWRSFIMGGLTIVSAMVIPLLVYVWNQTQETQHQIQSLSTITPQKYNEQ